MTGRGAVFAAGLRWAIENGMQVCNLSLGTTKRDFYAVLHELVDEAYFANVMLVTAAHNQPLLSFPSTYSSVISVASHDVRDAEVYYCNPQPPVEFGALGIDVRVAWRDGEWITATGNSFATPHIAGLVTRMLGKHPGLNVVHVKAILRALADNVVDASALRIARARAVAKEEGAPKPPSPARRRERRLVRRRPRRGGRSDPAARALREAASERDPLGGRTAAGSASRRCARPTSPRSSSSSSCGSGSPSTSR